MAESQESEEKFLKENEMSTRQTKLLFLITCTIILSIAIYGSNAGSDHYYLKNHSNNDSIYVEKIVFRTDRYGSKAQTAADPASAVDKIFAEWTDANSPSAAVTVVKDGQLAFSRGYDLANLEYEVPVSPATAFDIGSIAKQFTAFAVAVLAEQGKLSPEDDVRKYIPEMKARGGTIRIRHLLDHTSGLRDEFNLLTMEGFGPEDAVTFEHSVRMLTNQEELLFAPGERWEYCNSGYTLLAEIISRVTEKPYADWMRENVFVPLGMTGTSSPADLGTIIKGRAYSYTEGPKGWRTLVVSKSSLGCSNLFSTAEDMAKWAVNFTDAKVGGRAVIDRMSERGVLNDGTVTDYAYGQFIGEYRGLRTISHDGGVGGFRSALIRFPDQGIAVVVLANADYFRPTELAKKVAELFIGDLMQDAASTTKPAPAGDTADAKPVELKDCAGSYRLNSTGKVLEVIFQDAGLLLKNLARGGGLLALSRLEGNSFKVNGMDLKLSFASNEKGIVDRLILHVGDPPESATRISEMKLTEDQLAQFVGIYFSSELLVAYFLDIRDRVLTASHSRMPPMTLTPIGAHAFSGEKMWLRSIRFEVDEKGRPLGFHADAAYAKNVYFQKLK